MGTNWSADLLRFIKSRQARYMQCCTVLLESETISLYPKEFDVLLLLAQYPGWVFSSEQIYETVWNECVAGCEHVVYNVICQLRRKLKNPDLIQTMVERRYRFVG